VFFLLELPSATVVSYDSEVEWPLSIPLAAATPADLPPFYRQWAAHVTILPVRGAHGETPEEAFRQLTAALEDLQKKATLCVNTPNESTVGRAQTSCALPNRSWRPVTPSS
jgi:hypothetical protein